MNQESVNKVVEVALGAANAVPDADLKPVTYKIVLTELLRNASGVYTPQSPGSSAGNQTPPPEAGTPLAKVSAWLGLDAQVVEEAFEFNDDAATVHLSHTLLPNKAADAQRLLALLKLSAEKIGYEKDEVATKDIIEMFDNHGCKDGNVAKNLKASEYIVVKGGKGTLKSYKIRYSGLTWTMEEFKRVFGVDK